MNRRLIIIAITAAIALVLLVLNNKVLVGSQELSLELERPEPSIVEISFKDVAQREIALVETDEAGKAATLIQQIKAALDEDPSGPEEGPIGYNQDSFAVSESRIQFTLSDETVSDEALRPRLQGRSYDLGNPAKGLFHINLGIDLRGGVEFTCRLYDRENQVVAADEVVVGILRRRLDARGLTEPQVFRLTSGDVQVVIPGGTQADAARTRRVLETTGRLEIREVMSVVRIAGDGAHLDRPGEGRVSVDDSEQLVTVIGENRWFFGSDYREHFPRSPSHVIYPEKPLPGEDPTIFYHLGPVVLTGEDVSTADRGMRDGRPAVNISFTAAGGEVNRSFTGNVKARGPEGGTNTGTGRIAVTMDGVVESAPTVITPSGRDTQISGRFTDDEVESLRTVLVAGSLAVTPRVTSERVVGPSLGQETISKGAWSMVAGLMLVLATMWVYYRLRLGTVAVASLITTVGLVFVVLSVFGATLTLPGLAGLVLTVGMAVDANILIFERLREELTDDVDVATGIENGYGRAFITILDASLTTFLTAFILYLIGTGPVKGFGLTLMIGIVTSMFGALYVGRMLTDTFYKRVTQAKIPGVLKPLRLPYSSMRYGALVLSLVVAGGSWALFLGQGSVDDHFDIDFTGGNMVQVVFENELENEAVRAGLTSAYDAGAEMLDPGSIQLLPYFAEFGEGSNASRQWMFKARDTEGAVIERERAGQEDQRAQLHRQHVHLLAEQAESPEIDHSAEIAKIEKEMAGLDATIAELTVQVEERQEEFRHELEQAFADNLATDGHQVQSAQWDDAAVTLEVAILGSASAQQISAVQDQLSARDDIQELSVSAVERGDDRWALRMAATYAHAPDSAKNIVTEDPVARHLSVLLNAEDEAGYGQVMQASAFYEHAAAALAANGIAVDQPFPSSQHFSPLVGDQMKWRALFAMVVAVIVVLAYIAARFEFRYGIGAIVALVHDVVIAIGLLAVLPNIRIDLTVIAALLTIIGYSLNDTIVVFDRIRENIAKMEASLKEIIDLSIAQTMSRTLLTSGTTLAVVLILFLFGGEGVNAFAGTLLVGLILGTYSSIFVAAPVLVALNKGKPSTTLVEAATIDHDADLKTLDPEEQAAPQEDNNSTAPAS